MLQKAIVTTVDFCTRFAMQLLALQCFALVGGVYAARHFGHRCRRQQAHFQGAALAPTRGGVRQTLPPKKEPFWRHRRTRPPSLRRRPRLPSSRSCPAAKDLFQVILEAGGGPFFQKNGLLFLPTQEWLGSRKSSARPACPG